MLRLLERHMIAKKKVALVRPSTDKREYIARNGRKLNVSIFTASKISELDLTDFDVVGVDEGQFFQNLAADTDKLANRGAEVIVSALNGTSEQKVWSEVQKLWPLVDDIIFLHSVCDRCGEDGSFSCFVGGKNQQIIVGDHEYISLCRNCLDAAKHKK
jgi:thymidine kinase